MAKRKTAVILCNLGAPRSNTRPAVSQYLKSLLSDRQLVHFPSPIRTLMLKLLVLPAQSKKSWRALTELPQDAASSFLAISQHQQQALQQRLGADIRVELMMRYSNPGISSGIDQLLGSGYETLIILPLLPQQSGLRTSCAGPITASSTAGKPSPSIHVISDYHGNPDYIHALASSVQQHWRQHQRQRFLLICFAGLPGAAENHAEPYYDQCLGSANLLATILGLNYSQWALGFTSFHDRPTQLEPASAQILAAMAEQGLKEVDVICPGFATDCLETRVQVQVVDRAAFLAHGGEQYHYIACLNERDDHIEMMAELIRPYLAEAQAAGLAGPSSAPAK
ncbi:MAG: ferrochelatase [Gammaproteobacteria bacterium]|nr:ferrochelatase [Gammaproteobacteria bacterium]